MASQLRALGFWLRQYRRTWRGTVVSTLLLPGLFLVSMGLGVGSLIGPNAAGRLQGASYLAFVAPGLLGAVALHTATAEAMYPVMAAMRWHKAYHAMVAAPMSPADVLTGHLAFMLLRVAATCTVFVGYMALAGTMRSPWSGLVLLAAPLLGLACAAPITAYAAYVERDASLTMLARFVITPMFLFSGVFFPVTVLPWPVRLVVQVTPLWHGIELLRGLTRGSPGLAGVAGHLAMLAAWSVGGYLFALRTYVSRLTR